MRKRGLEDEKKYSKKFVISIKEFLMNMKFFQKYGIFYKGCNTKNNWVEFMETDILCYSVNHVATLYSKIT